jgi:hypothetical protein
VAGGSIAGCIIASPWRRDIGLRRPAGLEGFGDVAGLVAPPPRLAASLTEIDEEGAEISTPLLTN